MSLQPLFRRPVEITANFDVSVLRRLSDAKCKTEELQYTLKLNSERANKKDVKFIFCSKCAARNPQFAKANIDKYSPGVLQHLKATSFGLKVLEHAHRSTCAYTRQLSTDRPELAKTSKELFISKDFTKTNPVRLRIFFFVRCYGREQGSFLHEHARPLNK